MYGQCVWTVCKDTVCKDTVCMDTVCMDSVYGQCAIITEKQRGRGVY